MANTREILEILNIVREEVGYNDRIPELNQENLHNLTHLPPDELSKWLGVLVKIARSYSYSFIFDRSRNPFADFFGEKLEAGFSIEDLYVQLISGKLPAWNDDGTVALSREDPEVLSYYYKINYSMQYKITVSYAQARTAFATVSGVEAFLNRLLSQTSTACELDIYYECLELLSTMGTNGDMYTTSVSGFSTEANYEEFMLTLSNLIDDMTAPNNKYNMAKVLTSSRPEDLVIIATPKVINTINIMLLSGKFQLDKIDFKNRIIKVPNEYGFGSLMDANGVLAMVVDKKVFRIFPSLYEGSSNFNGAGLFTNNFLTVEMIFSYAKFENAAIIYDGSKTYTPSIGTLSNGTITTSPTGAQKPGTPITVTVTPSEGYKYVTNSLIVTTPNGTIYGLPNPAVSGGSVTFNSPAQDVTITADFAAEAITAAVQKRNIAETK